MKTNLKAVTFFAIAMLLIGCVTLLSLLFGLSSNLGDQTFTDSCVLSVYECQGATAVNYDNNYWKIENIRTNVWHVLFRNVGIKYEIRTCPKNTDTTTSLFEFREIGPKYGGILNDDSIVLKLTREELLEYWTKNNQGFEYVENGNGALVLTGSADNKYVFFCENYSHIGQATMEHFNNIQRGFYHPDAPNVINPNSHGRGNSIFNQIMASSNQNGASSSNNAKNYMPALAVIASKSASKNAKVPNKVIAGSKSVNTTLSHSSNAGNISAISASVSKQNSKSEDEYPSDRSGKTSRDIRSPLDQFSIRDYVIIVLPLLAGIELCFTSIMLNLGISTTTYSSVNILPLLWEKIATSKWFISIVSLYQTVFNLVKSQINVILGINFLPFFLCLFVYILTNNLVGMIPYTLAPTSHFILTFFISFALVVGVSILGFMIYKLIFFSLLVPHGCPGGLLPMLVLIETISYLARNVSLGLRLAANILSGHMLLNILSEFTYKIMNTSTIYFVLALIPITFISGFSGLELGIAFIQSQVFVVLGASYTKDSIQLH